MGFFSAIGSFISGAVSAVTGAIGSIGSSVAGIATNLLKVATPYIGAIIEAITMVGKLIGVLSPNDDVEELGAKAMQADKKPEDFESISDYIDYLRNDITIDKEKLKSADKTTKLASQAIGASIAAKGIEEKLDTSISMEFWKEVAKQKLKEGEIVKTIETYKKNDLDTADYEKYMIGDMKVDDRKKHSNALIEAYSELEPNLSKDEIEDKIMNLKNKSDE